MPRDGTSGEAATAVTDAADESPGGRTLASAALIAAGVSFLAGGALVILADTPPSSSPTLGMLSHALWALATALLAIGVVALLRYSEGLRAGLAGYLATGALGLGVLHGLQWVTWAYVDVRGARSDGHDLVLETVVEPFGAGHLLMYCILVGSGVALLGRALRRSAFTHRLVGWAGVALGGLTVAAATVSLVAVFGGGSEGHVLFDVATLLLPVLYLWAMAVGVDVYR